MLASSDSTVFTEDNFITGDSDIVTNNGVLASGNTIAQYTVLGRVTATGKLIPSVDTATDGSEVPVVISAEAVDASAADANVAYYSGGTFNPELLVWDASYSAEDKLAAFDGTNIELKTPRYSG